MIGYLNSIQTLGCVDGPGLRVVIFLQGCNLRCKCCHNPETWPCNTGTTITAEDLFSRISRYRSYFGELGGVTVSGGEPLLQAEFIYEFFTLCKQAGINTCLDTSGSILTDNIKSALSVTDRVLLDIKYTNNEDYIQNAGCSLDSVLTFLDYLQDIHLVTTIRHVLIPTINDSLYSINKLKAMLTNYTIVDSVDFLPFNNICKTKYEALNLAFPFAGIEAMPQEKLDYLHDYYYKS